MNLFDSMKKAVDGVVDTAKEKLAGRETRVSPLDAEPATEGQFREDLDELAAREPDPSEAGAAAGTPPAETLPDVVTEGDPADTMTAEGPAPD